MADHQRIYPDVEAPPAAAEAPLVPTGASKSDRGDPADYHHQGQHPPFPRRTIPVTHSKPPPIRRKRSCLCKCLCWTITQFNLNDDQSLSTTFDMASLSRALFLLSLLALTATISSAHNITEILSAFPDYSQYNSFLTQTKLADEINTRQTITILVLNNAAISALAAKHPLSVVKNALSLHVLLDYYDPTKLHQISKGSTLSTTLYQTTGHAPGNLGFVNITDLQGGKVGFGSAAPGSKLDSSYTKYVKQIPYNISILEINAPIIAPGILTAPAPSSSEVNPLYEGCGQIQAEQECHSW